MPRRALPTPGGADDFPDLVTLFSAFDPTRGGPAVVRLLFALRTAIGAALEVVRVTILDPFGSASFVLFNLAWLPVIISNLTLVLLQP